MKRDEVKVMAIGAAGDERVEVPQAFDPAALRVLGNTYRLLALTLVFSGAIAAVSAALRLPYPGLLLTLGGYFGLLFLVYRLQNSAYGLLAVFALTGFMGYTLGPLLSAYLAVPGGAGMVATALGTTGVSFAGLSWYATREGALDTRRFSGFLVVGIITAFCLGLAAYFFAMPALALAVSGMFVLLMAGMIMFQTQEIVRGGETNYILATVTLYVALYNLFASLLHLLGAFGGEE